MYNQKVLDAFAHPQNVGEIENPDGEGTVGNATCGDIMRITLRIVDDVIVDADVWLRRGNCNQQYRYADDYRYEGRGRA